MASTTLEMARKAEDPNEATIEQEHVDTQKVDITEALTTEVAYGHAGIRGILHSPFVFGAAVLASMGGFSFGYDQGVISLILNMTQFTDRYPETAPGAPSAAFYKGFMTGMLELGAFLGCLVYPRLADRVSRKWGLTIAVVFFDIGAVIQTASPNYAALVVGRTIGGIGVGTLAMGAPLYISEISPPELRGSLLVLEQMSIVIGAIISYWITYGTRYISSEAAFRLPFGLQMIPATLVGLGIHLFPYSPRWLALRGRFEDSLLSLSRLRRLPHDDDRVQKEWRSICAEVQFQQAVLQREHPGASGVKLELLSWRDMFRRKLIKRTIVGVGIAFFQQFSGINAFVYYAPTLFTTMGQPFEMSLILSGMVNIGQFVGVVPAILFMDDLGRRKLAIGGALGMAVPHTIMAGIVGKYHSSWSTHTGVGWFGVALVYIYTIVYGLTYGPLGWTLPAEVYPNAHRATGVGLATATNWLANFVIGVAVPPMITGIGFGTFVFFGAFCFLAAGFAFVCIPELAGKTLEQMDAVFGDNAAQAERDVLY